LPINTCRLQAIFSKVFPLLYSNEAIATEALFSKPALLTSSRTHSFFQEQPSEHMCACTHTLLLEPMAKFVPG